jgi:hypothetical protein
MILGGTLIVTFLIGLVIVAFTLDKVQAKKIESQNAAEEVTPPSTK